MRLLVNPLVRAILRSPLHPLLSGRLLLITYVGRRSGQSHTIPVGYSRRDDGTLLVQVGWAERKVWWRNLREEPRVEVVIRGHRRSADADVLADPVRVVLRPES